MNAAHCFAIAAISTIASLSAEVLIDFGRTDNRTTSTSPHYNNLAIGTNTGAAFNVTPTFQNVFIASNGGTFSAISHALADHMGSPSGWSISFQARSQQTSNAGQVGTAGTGGDYTGTLSAQSTSQFATTATGDGLYINNSGLLRIIVSGLDPASRYDLSAFSGRNGSATSDGGTWNLSAGTAITARIFLNGSSNPTANTGQWVDSYGANEGDHIEWLGVLPDANGRIQLDIATRNLTANAIAAINALRIATAAPVVPEEADVWLLGGQSNMQGLGKLNELTPAQLTAPADVFYWTGSTFVPLQPGTTQTASAGEFGPEIAFATQIAKRGRKAYIIKYANSGKPLDAGWNDQTWLGDPPAPNRVNFHPGLDSSDPNQGTLYKTHMLPRFQAGIAAITAQGSTPIMRGLAWMQGEQDSKNGTSAGRYAENLKRLRDRLASDLGLTSLPLVFGQVLPFEPALPRFTHRTEVRAEMVLADQDSGSPKAIPLCRMVSTDGFPVLEDTVHYTTAGQIKLGTALAEALAELTAKPIHLSFHNLSATADAMNPGNPPSAQGVIIDTATAHWNNLVNPAAHTFTKVPLLSADSSPSAANTTGSTGYTGTNANGWSTKNKDSVMMDGWYGFVGTESLSFDNLPGDLAQRYHVIIYGDSNDANRVMNYTINGVTKTIQDSGMFNNTFSEGGNYVVYSGLSGSSFTITGNAAGNPRSAVCGVSILPGDPLRITSFTANDQYVAPGSTATLSWNTEGEDTVEISPAVGNLGSDSVDVTLSETTTYTLTARKGSQSVSSTLRIHVGPERPNIVVFIVDDMGWQDTSVPFHHDANGNPVVTGFNQRYRTPHMAALAASGMKFTNAYTPSVCSPSRTSLMTGLSNARHRVTQWTLSPDTDQSGVSANLKSPLDWNINGLAPASDTSTARTWRTDTTLPGLLQDAGYRTIHVGKAHFGADGLPGEDPRALGFDINIAGHAAGGPSSFLGTANYASANPQFDVPGLEAYHGTDTYLTEALTLEGNKAVEKSVQDGKPFYLYMSHYAIHVPLMEDTRFTANYPGLDATERKYATMIEGMDKSLGDIRAKLQQLGVAENTLILFYSDNGGLTYGARGTTPDSTGANTHNKPLRAGKGSSYEGGTRIPAIAAWAAPDPANPLQQSLPIAPASRCEKPIIIEDIHPTLLEIADVSPPENIDGISFTGYLKNDPSFSRPVSLLFHYPHVWIAGIIGTNQGYEMHSSLREGDWKVIHFYEGSRWELYNLVNDLGEANNLAASRPDLVFQLGRKMIRMLDERGAQYPANRNTNATHRPLLPNNASVDSDNDGRSDVQEDPNRNGIVDPGETNPDDNDTDGDGTSDGAEARLGIDPLDPSSTFRATAYQPESDVLRITWPSMPGNTFTIRRSPDLKDWSEVIANQLPAAPEPARSTSHDVDFQERDSRFFQIMLD